MQHKIKHYMKNNELNGKPNRIEKSTVITEDIVSEADFRIDGTLEGSIKTSGKVVIGKTGVVDGVLICKNADVEGQFKGTLTVSDTLSLRASADVEGEVQIGKLSVEPGAAFNANCLMKGSVKELKNETPNSPSQNISKAGQSA